MASNRQSKHNAPRAATWLLMIMACAVLGAPQTNQVSHASGEVYDQIGGQVQGGSNSEVLTLYAWGGKYPGNVVQLTAVAQQTTSVGEEFGFRVARSQGQQAAAKSGISFRGWAVRLEGVTCGELQLRPPALPLRDNCEAGWLIRPWQTSALIATSSVIFSISSGQTIAGQHGLPTIPILPQPTTTPIQSPTLTVMPPAPDGATPTAATASDTPGATTQLPTPITIPPLPTTTPLNPDLPAQASDTPLTLGLQATDQPATTPEGRTNEAPPTATGTAVPLVIDVQMPLQITPLPTTAAAATAPAATPGLLLPAAPAPAPAPTNRTNAPTQNSGGIRILNLELWQVGLIVLILIALFFIIVRISHTHRGHRTPQYNANDDHTYDNFNQSNLAPNHAPAAVPAPPDPYTPPPSSITYSPNSSSPTMPYHTEDGH